MNVSSRVGGELARPAVSDRQLLAQARCGDHAAFVALVRRHDARLRGLAYKLLGDRDRMDDALQEAYLNAYRSLGAFRDEADVATWLYRIAYNACIDELRRAKRTARLADVAMERWDGGCGRVSVPEDSVAAADAVMRALSALPLPQRVAVVLVDGEGFDTASAAQILGVAPGTVASRLSRARATMRMMLGGDE